MARNPLLGIILVLCRSGCARMILVNKQTLKFQCATLSSPDHGSLIEMSTKRKEMSIKLGLHATKIANSTEIKEIMEKIFNWSTGLSFI